MAAMIPAWVDDVLTPVEKLSVHQRGLRHMAVSVFVMRGTKTLIQQRALGKYHTPGLWANTCCTHPNWGEDALTCANRRLEEELGITGIAPVFKQQVEYRADVGNGLIEHEVVEIFTADALNDMPLNLNPDEVMATKWIEMAELRADLSVNPQNYTPWLNIYLEKHSAAIFG